MTGGGGRQAIDRERWWLGPFLKIAAKARRTRNGTRNDGPIFVISARAVNFRRRESAPDRCV